MSEISLRVTLSTDAPLYHALRSAAQSVNSAGGRVQERDVLADVLADADVQTAAIAAAEAYDDDPIERRARALETEADQMEAKAARIRAQAQEVRRLPEPDPEEETTAR